MEFLRKRFISAIALFVYSAILIQVVVFKAVPVIHIGHLRVKITARGPGKTNLVPFKTIGPYLHGEDGWWIATANLAGNVIPFMPVGFLVPLVYRRMTWQRSLMLAVAVGLAMESTELILRIGVFDVDDILLNALGVMIGYWVFMAFIGRRWYVVC